MSWQRSPISIGIMPNNLFLKLTGMLLAILLAAVSSFAQGIPIPQDYNFSDRMNVLIDGGMMWQSNSTIHPLAIKRGDFESLSTPALGAPNWLSKSMLAYVASEKRAIDESDSGFGVNTRWVMSVRGNGGPNRSYQKAGVTPELWLHAYFHRNFFAMFQIRATSEARSLDHYAGRSKEISRAGLNSAEVDQSIFGYRNNWVQVDFGRSREIWGSQPSNNLLLAGNSPSYERLSLQLNYKQWQYRWFHAFLETQYDTTNRVNVHRYMTGRVAEFNNHKNLILSLGESIIYSGPNRPIEISELNPFSEHVEVETNGRDNNWENYSNSVFFSGMDWMVTPSLRISTQFAADEFRIEAGERKTAAEALLYFGKISWTPIRNSQQVTLYGYGYRIDTYSIQHRYKYDNFLIKGKPIGSPIGNDADDFVAGIRAVMPFPAILDVAYGRTRWGDNSIRLHPYTAYTEFTREPFPSGEIRTNHYLLAKLDSEPIQNLTIGFDGHFDLAHQGSNSGMESWTLTAQYTIPYYLFLSDRGREE